MKNITLRNGKVTVVDDDLFEAVKDFSWSFSTYGYAKRIKNHKTIWLHRLVMELGEYDGVHIVDHINGDKLDNRKANLRVVTKRENGMNRGVDKNKKYSNYKGVSRYKDGKFTAMIWNGTKSVYLGVFTDEKQAASAYQSKAKELFGEYARLSNDV